MRKDTGVSRPLDNLGRIVIPKEIRDALGLKVGGAMEIFVDGEFVIFRPYQPGCMFCGGMDELKVFHGKKICPTCIEEINDAL